MNVTLYAEAQPSLVHGGWKATMCWGLGVLFWALNNEHLFLRVLKAKKFKIKLPAASVSGKHPFLVCRWLLTCCNLTRHRFPKVTKPIMQTLPDCLPKACVCAQLLKQCPTLQPHGLQPARLLCPWDFPCKNTRMGCHFLLQGIFLTQRWNQSLLHCRQILLPLSHMGSPTSQRLRPPNTIILGIKSSRDEFWRDTNVQSIALSFSCVLFF